MSNLLQQSDEIILENTKSTSAMNSGKVFVTHSDKGEGVTES